MARLSHRNNKIVKLPNSSKLQVGVRRANSSDHEDRPPCPKKCSKLPLHIDFNVHCRNLYFDSADPSSEQHPIMEQHPTGEKTVCLDRRMDISEYKSWIMDISTALRSLNVKKYLQEKIINQILKYGTLCKSQGKRMPKGLLVTMVFIHKFCGDRDSIFEVMPKTEDIIAEYRALGLKCISVHPDSSDDDCDWTDSDNCDSS